MSDAQKEALRLAVSGMEKTVERYTGERVTIDPSMIHSLSDEFFSEVLQVEDNIDGKAFYDNLGVGVCIKPYSTPMSVAARTYHELGHFFSFQRSSVLPDFSGLQRENDGLTVFSEKRGVLGYYLTEGVVETLTRRFILEARNEPVFERERQILERQFPNAPKYAFLYMSKNGKKRCYGFGIAYDEAVRKVTETVEDIYQKHKDAFSSSEEVLGVFAKSLFTGRKLELARLIDSTYGEGSFRALLLETEG